MTTKSGRGVAGGRQQQGDKLVGTLIAHYVTKGADSVTVLRTQGTKAP